MIRIGRFEISGEYNTELRAKSELGIKIKIAEGANIGEGGEFDATDFEKVIEKFYKENF